MMFDHLKVKIRFYNALRKNQIDLLKSDIQ